jgi:oxygen-independent coproporphyrinogen-3 oxidase
MVHALLCEMDARKGELPLPLSPATLYFGGGTPSVLSPDELSLLIEKARALFAVTPFSEITLEVNPDDVTYDCALQWRAMGVNRLSVGIQSFHKHHLQRLRRRHSAAQSVACVAAAQAAGFDNISIDLMYGLPQQTDDEWRQDVAQALSLGVPHISAYQLTVEPKTLFSKQQAKGALSLPDEETVVQQFLFLHHSLESAGYAHYEVSNFARSGFRALHNSGYWQGAPYIGIGPAAHSYDGKRRRWNVANNRHYLRAMEQQAPAFEEEILTPEMRFNEYLLTSLRTADGADTHYIRHTFGEPFWRHCIRHAEKYLAAGTLVQSEGRWRIPPVHFIVSDEIIRTLFYGCHVLL